MLTHRARRGALPLRMRPSFPRQRPPRELTRFLMTGAATACGTFALMTLLVAVAELQPQVALALTNICALAVNFTLSRQWVWVHESGYAHRFSVQGRRYVLVAVCAYATTALVLATLPPVFDVRPLVVYFPAALVIACATFVTCQIWVFRSHAPRLLLLLSRRSQEARD